MYSSSNVLVLRLLGDVTRLEELCVGAHPACHDQDMVRSIGRNNAAWIVACIIPLAEAFLSPPSGLLLRGMPAKSFLSTRTAQQRMPTHSYRMAAMEPFKSEGGGGPRGSLFRETDIDLVKVMAEAEAKEGNSTGASMYQSIADRMESIKQRSQSRLAATISYSSSTYSDAEESGRDTREKMWTYANKRLTTEGDAVWYLGSEESDTWNLGPSTDAPALGSKPQLTAKTLTSYSAGAIVTWTVKINNKKGRMYLGVTTLGIDLDSSWSDENSVNGAYYLSDKGNLYNGATLIAESSRGFATGDVVKIKLDGDGLYFFVNDEELSASIKPIIGSVRLSLCLTQIGDGVSFVSEKVDRKEAIEVIISRKEEKDGAFFSAKQTVTLSRSIDDESESLLGKIFGDAEERSNEWKEVVDPKTNTIYWCNEATGQCTWEKPAGFVSRTDAFLDLGSKKQLEVTIDTGDELYVNQDAQRPSHTTVIFDDMGYANVDQFVYVDENTCIGCTNCATVARQTFYMNDEFGRARVFRQGGDAQDVIQEAVATCPVDCIWYVSWDDLVILENERVHQVINPTARLVGSSFIESSTVLTFYGRKDGVSGGPSKASIMNSGKMRCNNCPGRGCAQCPLYGVGENPEYLKKKKQKEQRKRAKKEAKMQARLQMIADGDEDVNLLSIFDSDSESTEFTTTEVTEFTQE